MISREEAKKKMVFKLNAKHSEDTLTQLLDEVYDSIGTCGDCKHFNYEHIGVGICGDGKTLNRFELEDYIPDSWYCADFERKQDDTE